MREVLNACAVVHEKYNIIKSSDGYKKAKAEILTRQIKYLNEDYMDENYPRETFDALVNFIRMHWFTDECDEVQSLVLDVAGLMDGTH
jgi:hypothetical protein